MGIGVAIAAAVAGVVAAAGSVAGAVEKTDAAHDRASIQRKQLALKKEQALATNSLNRERMVATLHSQNVRMGQNLGHIVNGFHSGGIIGGFSQEGVYSRERELDMNQISLQRDAIAENIAERQRINESTDVNLEAVNTGERHAVGLDIASGIESVGSAGMMGAQGFIK